MYRVLSAILDTAKPALYGLKLLPPKVQKCIE